MTQHRARHLAYPPQAWPPGRTTSTGACCASYRLATGGSTISTAKISPENDAVHCRLGHPHETISARGRPGIVSSPRDMEDEAPGETIPDFHSIRVPGIGGLRDAVARDEAGRLGKCRNGLACLGAAVRMPPNGSTAKARSRSASRTATRRSIRLLFDELFCCVIDLDTTMPGYVLSDFGDFIRQAPMEPRTTPNWIGSASTWKFLPLLLERLSRKRGLVPDGRRTRDADLRSADADLQYCADPDGLWDGDRYYK